MSSTAKSGPGKSSTANRWRALAALVLVGGTAALAFTSPAKLGLDLRGGTQIVLEADAGSDRNVDGDTLARTLEVLRRRVDQLGVAEPTLQRSGERRVIVELPGVYDPQEAVPFWQRMSSGQGRSGPPEFLSTHPSGDTRIRQLREWMPEALSHYRPQK